MKKIFLLVIVPLVALGLGAILIMLIKKDSGHVLIAYQHYSVQMSFWVGMTMITIGSGLFWGGIWLAFKLFSARGVISSWLSGRGSKKNRVQTTKGLIEFTEGNWVKAKRELFQSASKAETPLVNYLMAAQASSKMGDFAGAEACLREADKVKGASLAAGVTQAQLQYDSGRFEQSLATLMRLKVKAPKNKLVLGLLKDVYVSLEDWRNLEILLPELKKHKVLDATQFNAFELECYQRIFNSYAQKAHRQDEESIEKLKGIWKRTANHISKNTLVALSYVDALIACGEGAEAESTIRGVLNKSWDDELVVRYGQVKGRDPLKQLSAAEKWLKERPNNAVLLLALGRISIANNRLSEAQEYFENSHRIERTPQVLGELGRLLAHFNQYEKSTEYLSQSVAAALPGQSPIDLPLPKLSESAA